MQGGQRRVSAFGRSVAGWLEERSTDLAREWLDVLLARLPVEPTKVFPEQTLLDHVPLLIRRIAQHLAGTIDLHTDPFVDEELQRIGELRRSQGYSPVEVGIEFDELARVVFEACERQGEVLERAGGGASARDVFDLAAELHQVFRALSTRVIRDMTRARTSEQAVRDELLNAFGRNVTHELRNRLNTCLLALHGLESGPVDKRERLLSMLRRALVSVENVVGDVFSVAVMRGTVDPDGIDRDTVANVLRDVVGSLAELAASRNVALRLDGELPSFFVDASRLRVVLANLLSNAVKYAAPEREDRHVRLWVTPAGGREWLIHVADNGRGIAAEELPHIFKSGVRGNNSSDQPGEGLGLALAARAAEQLGGKLTAVSQPGDGTTFTFSVHEPATELIR